MTAFLKSVGRVMALAFRDNLALLVMTLVHVMAAVMIARMVDAPYGNRTSGVLAFFALYLIPAFCLFLLVWRLGQGLLFLRPARPLHWFATEMRDLLTDARRLLAGAVAVAASATMIGAFGLIKDLIPRVNPFTWDPWLADLDLALHFGVDPYVLLKPVLDIPLAISGINAAYHLWLFMNLFAVFVACFTPARNSARAQFLISFFLTWAIVGNVLAILMPSAGPVFYERLGLGDHFAPLMARLHEINEIYPVLALKVQDALWASHIGQGQGISGISAMPSMHVASTVVLMLYAYGWRTWAGHAMAAFLVVIQIGSVVLAYHYAVDGYLGGAVALAIWKTVGWLRQDRKAADATPTLAPAA